MAIKKINSPRRLSYRLFARVFTVVVALILRLVFVDQLIYHTLGITDVNGLFRTSWSSELHGILWSMNGVFFLCYASPAFCMSIWYSIAWRKNVRPAIAVPLLLLAIVLSVVLILLLGKYMGSIISWVLGALGLIFVGVMIFSPDNDSSTASRKSSAYDFVVKQREQESRAEQARKAEEEERRRRIDDDAYLHGLKSHGTDNYGNPLYKDHESGREYRGIEGAWHSKFENKSTGKYLNEEEDE